MELLEFKNKIFSLLHCKDTKEIGNALLKAVLSHDLKVFRGYKEIAGEDEKDWLQSLWQYYEADREEKKQDYTPISLCRLVSAISGECETVYDCCGGSGALTLQIARDNKVKEVCVEELDKRVLPFLLFNLCLKNVNGIVLNKNVLTNEVYKKYIIKTHEEFSTCEESDLTNNFRKFDIAVSNPPYNIKWQPPTELEAILDNRFPVIPPACSANYAFALNCLSRSEKAVLILPNGIATEETEKEVREYLVDADLVEALIIMPDKMFEVTTISTCILILNRNKPSKGNVIFIDSRHNCVEEVREQNGQFGGASHTARTYKKTYNSLSEENISKIINAIKNEQTIAEFSAVVPNKKIAENDYVLSPSRYIEFKSKDEEHRSLQDIADNLNYITQMQNSCKLVINETIAKKLGLDIDLFRQGQKQSEETKKQMKALGIDLISDDYIQFTKNKNEFAFKCNDKELLPECLIQFLTVWKNQIAMLNTMQNKYLVELRDALLPDLMSGKIKLRMKDDDIPGSFKM